MRTSISIADLQSIPPDSFELLVGQLLESAGLTNVVILGGSGDGGFDIRAEWRHALPTGQERPTVWAVQCKRYKSAISGKQIDEILNAMLSPSVELFPTRPDYFLLAVTSRLSVASRKKVDLANHAKDKYGCHFIVWEGKDILRRIENRPAMVLKVLQEVRPESLEAPQSKGPPKDVRRLTILVDELKNETRLNFLYDSLSKHAPIGVGQSYLSADYRRDLQEQLRKQIAGMPRPEFREREEQERRAIGLILNKLIPNTLGPHLFDQPSFYLHIATNDHYIPFELAYDEGRGMRLEDVCMIGRTNLSATNPTVESWSIPSILLCAPAYVPEGAPVLPGAQAEAQQLSTLLSRGGYSVETLVGEEMKYENLVVALSNNNNRLVHYAGHFGAAEDGAPVVYTHDRELLVTDMLAMMPANSLMFLSSDCSLIQLSEIAEVGSKTGVYAILGFDGRVRDREVAGYVVAFYEALLQGNTLGEAMAIARQSSSGDNSSFIERPMLFGDPSWIIRRTQ